VHRVTDDLGMAFAGSVKIGFALLEDLQGRCLHSEKLRNPEALMAFWPRCARHVFAAPGENERKLGSQLLIFGIDRRKAGERMPVLYRLESPRFVPHKARNIELLSVGCGGNVKEYEGLLRSISCQPNPLKNWGVGFPGHGLGPGLAYVMLEEHRKLQAKGVSDHLLCCVLARRGFLEIPNNQRFGDGSELRMPHLAASYGEFVVVARSLGVSAARAAC
jgi:hypothetical protein